MYKRYSIAEARHDLASIVHELEDIESVELTRRGQPVAYLISVKEFERLHSKGKDFWESLSAFRNHLDLSVLGDVSDVWQDVRDRSTGRE